jgi:hypothetical protein
VFPKCVSSGAKNSAQNTTIASDQKRKMQLQRELDRLGGKHKAIKDELAIAMTLATEVAVALEEQGEGEKV